jgi:hypothetical protein
MKVVLDAPYGDWNWMQFVDLAGTMSVPMSCPMPFCAPDVRFMLADLGPTTGINAFQELRLGREPIVNR